MGDLRFDRALERIRQASDRPAALAATATEDLIMALAAVSPEREPLLANILATELLNRARRQGAVAVNIAEGVYIVDQDGIITYVNPSAERLIGTRAEALVGHRADAIRLRDEAGALIPWEARPTRRAVMEGRESPPMNVSLERADGALIPIAMTAAPVRADGEILGAVLSFRDISEQRTALDEVRFHKALLDHVGEAVVATRPDGTILYWNRSAERLFGWQAEEVVGRAVVGITTDLAQQEEASAIMERMKRGRSWSGTFTLRHRGGGTFPAHVTNAPVFGRDGQLVAIIGVSRPLEGPPQAPQRPSRGTP